MSSSVLLMGMTVLLLGYRLIGSSAYRYGQPDERLGEQGYIWWSSPERFDPYLLIHD